MAAGAAAAGTTAAADVQASRGRPAPDAPGPAKPAAPARSPDLAGHIDPAAAAGRPAAVAGTGPEVRAVRAGAAPAGPVARGTTGSAFARPGPGHRRETVPQRYRLGGLAADSSRPSPRRRRCFLPIPGRHGRLPERTISANLTLSRDQAVSGRRDGPPWRWSPVAWGHGVGRPNLSPPSQWLIRVDVNAGGSGPGP
jgi:hypothetical protein